MFLESIIQKNVTKTVLIINPTRIGGIITDSTTIGYKATAGTSDFNELITLFQAALEEEIVHAKKKKNSNNFTLKKGHFIFNDSESWVYRFAMDDEISIPDDTPVEILLEKQNLTGCIVSSDEDGINIAFNQNLGESIPEVTIISADFKLIEDLVTKFNNVKKDDISLNKSGCMNLFGFNPPVGYKKPVLEPDLSIYDFHPNSEQKEAIVKSLSQEITFIWGPPGTGKTKVLGVILDQLIRKGKRVLLTSHTNLAVDEILYKYVKNPDFQDIINAGKIVRYGIASRSDSDFDKILIDTIVQQCAASKLEEVKQIEERVKELEQSLEKYQNVEILKKLDTIDIYDQRKSKIDASILEKTKEIKKLSAEHNKLSENLKVRKQELEKYQNSGFFSKVLSSTNPTKLKADIEHIEQNIKSVNGKIEQKRKDSASLEKNKAREVAHITQLRKELETIAADQDVSRAAVFTRTSLNNEKQNILGKIDIYREKINEIQQEIHDIRKNVVTNAQVVGCTLTKAYLDPRIYQGTFDVMILDEASMAPLPAVFFAAGLVDQGHYIISGDFRQLSPIASSEEDAAAQWLRRDIFAQAGIEESTNSDLEDDRLVMLREQYRMHPEIMDLINIPMYSGKLRAGDFVLQEKPKITAKPPYENKALVLVDTSTINPWCKRLRSGSKINVYNAVLAVRLTKMLLEGGIKNVGIITPYNAQGKLISKMLEDEKIGKEHAMAATIHKFQGNERECIIFDTVDGPPYRAGRLLSGTYRESEAGKLINVAISRAEGKFIVIGNSA
ncbi:AAA domain-containing protein, partial [Methanocalculus sp.]|uniref:AAA domain-containing protein n=1 Tax=Methanocalculus sp. TaxID=2004547 RepID=UPI00261E6602